MALTLADGSRLTVRGQPISLANDVGLELVRFADGTTWDRAALAAQVLATTPGDDAVVGGYQNDTFEGGAGNDRFQDLGGDDTYVFGVGDGQDVIEDTLGRIQFKPDIGQNDVAFTRDGNDLIATVRASGDAVRVKNWLNGSGRIDRFAFANGVQLSASDVQVLLNVRYGAEIFYGTPGDDRLTGTEKDSTLYGRDGKDTLTGGAGRDELYGEGGDDTLVGGIDRDVLYGGKGNNTYVMAVGMGLDQAIGEALALASDTVVFAAGIRPQDVSVQLGTLTSSWAKQAGDAGYQNLVIGFGGNDALMLRTQTWGDLGRGAIQRFRFDDGTEWTLADLIARADGGAVGYQAISGSAGTALGSQADDDIYNYTDQSVTVQARGNNDNVQLKAGNDIVSAGTGNDTVKSGAGNDLIAGEAGDDRVNAEEGDDVLVFNYGDGRDNFTAGEGMDTLSFGASVTPDMLSVALESDGRVQLLVDGGAGGVINLNGTSVQSLPGDLERVQFIAADGKTRVFDLTGWLRANTAALLSATTDRPLAFNHSGFELTGAAVPAGALEALAYAQSGNLFTQAALAHNNPTDGNDVLYGTARSDILDAGMGNDMVLGLTGDDVIRGGGGDDLIHGGDGNDVLDGNAGDDVIYGGDGNDVLDGNAGDDVIYGGWGADQLTGGTGKDQLFGEWGGDTYLYQSGHGEVIIEDDHRVLSWGGITIVDFGGGEGGFFNFTEDKIDTAPNILRFGPGIRPEDLRYAEQNGDLVIEFANQPGDRLILRGYEPGRATQTRSVDIMRFADGTEIVAASIETTGKTKRADEGDWLLGTPYADTLIGGDGNDVLDGQGGTNRLAGGVGSDEYRINKVRSRPAVETLIAETWREQDHNRIQLSGAITAADLRLEFDGHDLLLRLTQDGDAIRFAGFDPRAPGMRAPVAEIGLPLGSSLSFDDLLARGVHIIGTPENDVLNGTALADWIEGREADDTMRGGAGGDSYVIDADAGSDTIIDSEDGDAPNVLVLPEGTTRDDVRLSYDDEGFLILDLDNTGNRIRLSGFDPENPLGSRAVDRVRFGLDGESVRYEALLERGFDLFGTGQDDALKGTTLADRVRGGDGNDVIEATPGGDWLAGEGGNDAYVVQRGDGVVTIDDLAKQGAGNVLRFGAGINPNALRNSLRFEADGNGGHVLLIPYGGEGDVVRLTGFNPEDVLGSHAVDRFEFADGTAVDYATLVSWTFVVEGDNAGNVLAGTNVNDRLYGYDGEDVMQAGGGEDVLTGGVANDVLRGGAGRDAYVVNLGDGEDVIEDAVEAGIGNVLTFGNGIAREDIGVEVDGNDLLIRYGAGGDTVRVRQYESNGTDGGTVIDTFEFADGKAVTLREFLNRAPEIGNHINDQSILEDAALSLRLPDDLFIDADNILTQVTVAGYETAPDWLHYDAATRTLSGTPDNDDVGEFDVIVQGMDTLGASSLHSFHVTVHNTNDAPGIGARLADQAAHVATPFNWQLPQNAFIDVDAQDVLRYTARLTDGSALPAWLTFDAATGSFSGKPTTAGSTVVQVTATDLAGAAVSQSFTINIVSDGVNLAPVTAPDNATVTEDRKLRAWGNVLSNDRDPEDQTLRVADAGIRRGEVGVLTLLSNGAYEYALNNYSTRVQGLGLGETMLERFSYFASDTAGRSSGELVVTVQGANDAPALARCLPDVQLAKGKAFAWNMPADSFTDQDRHDSLHYTATLLNGKPLPAWLKFDGAAMTFSGKAPANAKDSIEVLIVASDGHAQYATASDVFKISFGKKTVLSTTPKGNEGLGNGPDAPPPGHGYNHNDGPGTSPGQPGRRPASRCGDDAPDCFLDGYKTAGKNVQPALDRKWFDQWDERQQSHEESGHYRENYDFERHWSQLTGALNRMDAERQSAPGWSHANQGADISALTGLTQGGPATRGGVDTVSLACGGSQRKGFDGLHEGMSKLTY
jgi:VCBS repeat-containing protein